MNLSTRNVQRPDNSFDTHALDTELNHYHDAPELENSESYVFTRPKTPIKRVIRKSLAPASDPVTPERSFAVAQTSTPNNSKRPNFDEAGFDLDFDESIFADLDSPPFDLPPSPTSIEEKTRTNLELEEKSLYSVTQLVEMINSTQSKTQADKSVHEESPDFDIGDIFIEQLLSLDDSDEILESSLANISVHPKSALVNKIVAKENESGRKTNQEPDDDEITILESSTQSEPREPKFNCVSNENPKVKEVPLVIPPNSAVQKSGFVKPVELDQEKAEIHQVEDNRVSVPPDIEPHDDSDLNDSLSRFGRKLGRKQAFLATQAAQVQEPATPETQDSESNWKSEESGLNLQTQEDEVTELGVESPEEASRVVKRGEKTRKRKRAVAFIDEEAAESGEGSGDDHSDSYLQSSYDSSFVDDDEEASGVDIRGLYLQQTKSPLIARRLKFAQLQGKASDFCSQAISPRDSAYLADSFCVGSEDEDEEWIDETRSPEDTLLRSSKQKLENVTPVRKKRRRIVLPDSSPEKDPSPVNLKPINQHVLDTLTSPILDRSVTLLDARQRRLKRQKELQEAFKSRLVEESQKSNQTTSSVLASKPLKPVENMASEIPSTSGKESVFLERGNSRDAIGGSRRDHVDKNGIVISSSERGKTSPRLNDIDGNQGTKIEPEERGRNESAVFQPILPGVTRSVDNPVILISSRLSSGAPELVSKLRFDHHCTVKVTALEACDMIISKRVGALRTPYSEFSNGSNKLKLVEEVRRLSSQFDRPTLVVELDRVKNPKSEPCMKPHSKYVTTVSVALGQSNVRIFHSSSQDETAAIINSIARSESRKGYSFPDFHLSPKEDSLVKILLHVPELNLVGAVCLVKQLKSIKAILTSPEKIIMDASSLSRERAKRVQEFFKQTFALSDL